jgi:splicing factor 3A subunit 3
VLQEFTCEICGGASYWGRRAFERHFKEWRHQNGMRALGIPNNKNFFEVTQIKDARELWASIQVSPDISCQTQPGIFASSYESISRASSDACALYQERELGGFKADVEEEFEDAEGNVFNRRTYEDLKRQGLI